MGDQAWLRHEARQNIMTEQQQQMVDVYTIAEVSSGTHQLLGRATLATALTSSLVGRTFLSSNRDHFPDSMQGISSPQWSTGDIVDKRLCETGYESRATSSRPAKSAFAVARHRDQAGSGFSSCDGEKPGLL